MLALGVSHSVSSVYHSESQGELERCYQTLKKMLQNYSFETDRDLDSGLPLCCLRFVMQNRSLFGSAPFELVFGHNVQGPLKVLQKFMVNPYQKTNIFDFVTKCKTRLRTAGCIEKFISAAQELMKGCLTVKAVACQLCSCCLLCHINLVCVCVCVLMSQKRTDKETYVFMLFVMG